MHTVAFVLALLYGIYVIIKPTAPPRDCFIRSSINFYVMFVVTISSDPSLSAQELGRYGSGYASARPPEFPSFSHSLKCTDVQYLPLHIIFAFYSHSSEYPKSQSLPSAP